MLTPLELQTPKSMTIGPKLQTHRRIELSHCLEAQLGQQGKKPPISASAEIVAGHGRRTRLMRLPQAMRLIMIREGMTMVGAIVMTRRRGVETTEQMKEEEEEKRRRSAAQTTPLRPAKRVTASIAAASIHTTDHVALVTPTCVQPAPHASMW